MSQTTQTITREKTTLVLLDLLEWKLKETNLSKKEQEEILSSMNHHIDIMLGLYEFKDRINGD